MTTKVIVYPAESGGVNIINIAPDCPLPIEAIARKDVPGGAPYVIVDTTYFDDQLEKPRVEWEADFTEPAGFGDTRYGAGTDNEVLEYFTQADQIIYLKARNINTGDIIELQA